MNLEIKDLVLKGLLDGAKAFVGPETVQFDITNRCNNNCLCCWRNSPLLGESSEEDKREKEFELPFSVIKKTIDELKIMGTKKIFFAGGGDPFVHPKIMKILRYAKKCKMKIYINTNFTLVDKKRARELVKLKVDHIHVSVLAGNSKTYSLVHPNKSEEMFCKIKKVLKYIAVLKKNRRQHLYNPLPHINLYYVIFNKNYKDINEMVDLAIYVKSDTMEFTPIDVVAGKTDSLLLNAEQINSVTNDVKNNIGRLRKCNKSQSVKINIEQSENFLKRINSSLALEGKYESKTVINQPCYVGWAFARITADGEVNPCLKAHRISIGNIYKNSFEEIWNSPEEQEFRRKSFNLNLNDIYLKDIGNDPNLTFGCLQSCDNLQISLDMNKKYIDILRGYGKVK
ncbi:MAG: radical SAM protein [Candidatus Omnitrophica bacterium]|nr:radical SAM protein [Candidatus Omnitrophota bacterium]